METLAATLTKNNTVGPVNTFLVTQSKVTVVLAYGYLSL